MSLADRVALVTGSSRGLGRAIARRLAREGAAIAVNYVQKAEEAESLAGEIRSDGGHALVVRADVADERQVSSMVDSIGSELGPVDILVNNAGLLRRGDLDQFDPADLELMHRTNVLGVIHTTHAVACGMKERRFGRIVNITSVAGHGTALPGTTFYASTKAAVALLTRRLAMELGPYGITVNAVAPGFILTDMARQEQSPKESEMLVARVSRVTMVQRVGRPEDVAHAVAFLVSPKSGFITAQIITVDGGRMDYIAHS